VLLLIILSLLALVASIAVGRHLYPESRGEAALHACLTALSIVLVPIQALGWTGTLTRTSLTLSVLSLSVLALAAGLSRQPRGERARHLARDVTNFFRLPLDAAIEAWRARSSVMVLLPATLALLAWTFWLAWLAPSGSWDGLWYHEPMVGFAIQNRGFELVELPIHLEWVNGYPRTSEHLMLWATIFGDRRLIDGVPSVMALLSLLAFVCMARTHGNWPIGAVGFGCVLLTIPGVILQMRSTYIDVTVLAGYLAALHYATRPDFRSRDAWSLALALGFLGGTKATGLAYVVLLGGAGVLRIVALVIRSRRLEPIFVSLVGLALVALLVVPSYARNYALHENPIWPLRYESRLLGTFEGPHDISNMQLPFDQVLHEMFGAPTPGQDYHDTRRHAFGYSLTFLGLPLFILALFAMLVRAITAFARRDRPQLKEPARLLALLGLGGFPLATSPAFYWARYSLPSPAVALVAIHAWLSRGRRRTFADGAIFAMGVLNLITLAWAAPGWDVPFETALALASQTTEERVHAQVSHNLLPAETSRLREERIRRGDLVVFDDEVAFIGNLWNEEMSNHVRFVRFTSRSEYLERLHELSPEWVVVRHGSAEEAALQSSEGQYVRLADAQDRDVIWERTPR
jgi:hypothetical protein